MLIAALMFLWPAAAVVPQTAAETIEPPASIVKVTLYADKAAITKRCELFSLRADILLISVILRKA